MDIQLLPVQPKGQRSECGFGVSESPLVKNSVNDGTTNDRIALTDNAKRKEGAPSRNFYSFVEPAPEAEISCTKTRRLQRERRQLSRSVFFAIRKLRRLTPQNKTSVNYALSKYFALTGGVVGQIIFIVGDLSFVALKGVHDEKEIVRNHHLCERSRSIGFGGVELRRHNHRRSPNRWFYLSKCLRPQ